MPGAAWEQWQIERLKTLLAKGFSAREMRIGARTPAAIQNKAARMNLVGDGIARKPWPAAHEERLKQRLKAGWTPSRIARFDEVLSAYSRNAIVKKSSRMNLADPERSRRASGAIRLTPGQIARFHEFLREHAADRTPEEIALLWNQQQVPTVSRRRVIYHLEKLNIKPPWRAVIRMPFSKAKQRNSSARSLESTRRRWLQYREELVTELRDRALELRRESKGSGNGLKERVCRSCKKRWPAARPFFHLHTKKSSSGARKYLSRICRLCQNKKRRDKYRQNRSA